MSGWFNLHTLPRGTHQYTAWVGDENDADEVDFTSGITDPKRLILEAKEAAFGGDDPMYDAKTQSILQIVDQCCSELVVGPNG